MKWNCKQAGRAVIGGLVVWALPFGISLVFYDQTSTLLIDIFAFKTLMMIVSALVGLTLLARQIPAMSPPYKSKATLLTLIWLLINWLLDFVILLPLAGMNSRDYFLSTGLRYLQMPLSGFFMGLALDRLVNRKHSGPLKDNQL
ncbi:MAG: hypothetical protein KDK39_12145 [Leptospiraceae bacterium]|nr:hypothetical protein [Leptospiraceae bacterium]